MVRALQEGTLKETYENISATRNDPSNIVAMNFI